MFLIWRRGRWVKTSVLLLALFFGILMPLGVMGISRNSTGSSSNPSVVNIGVLFTLDSVIGRSAQPAILAAVDDVNADNTILSGTKLNLILHDTNCSGFLGTVEGTVSKENSICLLYNI